MPDFFVGLLFVSVLFVCSFSVVLISLRYYKKKNIKVLNTFSEKNDLYDSYKNIFNRIRHLDETRYLFFLQQFKRHCLFFRCDEEHTGPCVTLSVVKEILSACENTSL